MSELGSACIASASTGLTTGSAASMVMMPIVPDKQKYPTGRNLKFTRGEIGLAGHWTKLLLHHMFIYKAKALPGWQLIPELRIEDRRHAAHHCPPPPPYGADAASPSSCTASWSPTSGSQR